MTRIVATNARRRIVHAAACALGFAAIKAGAQPPNINVSQRDFNQAEVTIAVNPANPNNLIAASNNLDNTATEDLSWYSLDGGATWTVSAIPNPPGSTPGGDPSVVFDRLGNAYYSHLIDCGLAGCDVASSYSTDGGATWTAAAITTTSGKDKNFFGIGPDANDLSRDRVYVGYQDSGVQFVQSTIDGINWSAAVQVSDAGNDGINIQFAVDDAGIVYAAWQGMEPRPPIGTPPSGFSDIFFDVSLDGGQTWGTDGIAYTTNVAAFRDPFVASTCGTQYCVPAAPDRGVGAFLALEADRSLFGLHNGRIYMSVLDQGDLDGDPDANNAVDHDDTDVFILYSDDQGQNWTGPIRVNDDTTLNSQFLPWLDVDQVTGGVAVGWYDARNDDGLSGPGDTNGLPNDDAQYFVAVSYDGGDTFLPNQQVSQGTSNQAGAEPYPTGFVNFDFGEYPGVAMHDSIVHATWADNSNSTGDNPDGALGTMDVYAAAFFVNGSPSCDANGPYIAECGVDIALDGTGSSDPNGDSLSFLWTGPFSGGTAIGPTPSVQFPAPTGEKSVTLQVDDGIAAASCDADVNVQDTLAPTVVAPADEVAECEAPEGTTVDLGTPTVSDLCDAAPAVANDAPPLFPLGATVVTWTATDADGNVGTDTQNVTVVDTTPPVIESVAASPDVLWPPNHKMVPVAVTAVVTDACDAAPLCRVISVASNEPINGLGDGDTAPDWEITGDLTVNLRAERSGLGDGRVYTIEVECSDASGNVSADAVAVTVPHDLGKGKK